MLHLALRHQRHLLQLLLLLLLLYSFFHCRCSCGRDNILLATTVVTGMGGGAGRSKFASRHLLLLVLLCSQLLESKLLAPHLHLVRVLGDILVPHHTLAVHSRKSVSVVDGWQRLAGRCRGGVMVWVGGMARRKLEGS